MDFIIEFFAELLLEIFVEGSIVSVGSKRTPWPLRILAGFFLGVLMFLFVLIGIVLILNSRGSLILILLGIIWLFFLALVVYKFYKKIKENENK